MKQAGFTLIELAITVTIASMMIVALYQVYTQSNDVVRRIRSFLLYTETLPLTYQQFEQDIAGIFVPQQGYPEAPDQVVTNTQTKQPVQAQEKPKEKPAKIQEVVYTNYDKDTLVLLTFITTNPLIVYGEVVPHVVRVTYRLEKMPNSDLFRLMRSESTDLVFDKENIKKDGIEIMSEIKKLSAKFYVQPKAKDKEKEKKSPTKEYSAFSRWTTEEREKTNRIIPDFIEISGSIVIDARHERERNFVWEYHIAAQERQEEPTPAQPLQATPNL